MRPMIHVVSFAGHRAVEFADSSSVKDLRVDRDRIVVELCGQRSEAVLYHVPALVIGRQVDPVLEMKAIPTGTQDRSRKTESG